MCNEALAEFDLPSDPQLAIHEAGHAVVAVALGWRLHIVTIVPEPLADGRTMHGRCKAIPPLAYTVSALRGDRSGAYRLKTEAELDAEVARICAKREAIFSCAGLAAEHFYRRGEARASDLFFAAGPDTIEDVALVYAWAGYQEGTTVAPAVLRRAEAVYMQAARMLARPAASRAVRGLAAELVARRTIPGPEAEQIIGKARRARS